MRLRAVLGVNAWTEAMAAIYVPQSTEQDSPFPGPASDVSHSTRRNDLEERQAIKKRKLSQD